MTTSSRPEQTLRLTADEIVYLLGLRPGPAATRSRGALLLDGLDDDAGRRGEAALFARGLLAARGPEFLPSGDALAVGSVLTSATRWTTIQLVGAEGRLAVVVDAPDRTLILALAAFGTYEVGALAADVAVADAVTEIAERAFAGAGVDNLLVAVDDERGQRSASLGPDAAERAGVIGDLYRPQPPVGGSGHDQGNGAGEGAGPGAGHPH